MCQVGHPVVGVSGLHGYDDLGYLLKRISDSEAAWIEIEGANAEIIGCTEAVALQTALGTPFSKPIWIEGLYLKASVLCSVTWNVLVASALAWPVLAKRTTPLSR